MEALSWFYECVGSDGKEMRGLAALNHSFAVFEKQAAQKDGIKDVGLDKFDSFMVYKWVLSGAQQLTLSAWVKMVTSSAISFKSSSATTSATSRLLVLYVVALVFILVVCVVFFPT